MVFEFAIHFLFNILLLIVFSIIFCSPNLYFKDLGNWDIHIVIYLYFDFVILTFKVYHLLIMIENPLKRRQLELSDGKFGKALHIKHGWSVTRGTANESGIDLDLIVSTMWGDWRTKPHYWGTGKFYGERGSVAFWVKTSALNPGIVFIQGSTAWGRKERDLLRIDLDKDGEAANYISLEGVLDGIEVISQE